MVLARRYDDHKIDNWEPVPFLVELKHAIKAPIRLVFVL